MTFITSIKSASTWICLALVAIYCSEAVAESPYRLYPAQPLAGQEIIITPYVDSLCTVYETKEPATLTGSTIHAVVEVRNVICP